MRKSEKPGRRIALGTVTQSTLGDTHGIIEKFGLWPFGVQLS